MKTKKLITLLLLVSVFLCCSACADESGEQDPPKSSTPIYGYEDITKEKSFTEEESGTVYASYRYIVPMLRVANADELTEESLTVAQRSTDAFNAKMQEILDESVAYGEEMAQWYVEGETFSGTGLPLADEKVLSLSMTGSIISVMEDGYFYGGGAHPNSYTASYTFDLSTGEFIDPATIADDSEAFRIMAAALLVQKAESLGDDYTAGFFPDYAETISHWNERAVLFDKSGMTVIFSVYDIGPYAMGPVELHLTYPELAEMLGENGLARLGIELPNN